MSRPSEHLQVPPIADDDGALEAQWAGISKKRAERAIRRRSTVTAMVGAAAATPSWSEPSTTVSPLAETTRMGVSTEARRGFSASPASIAAFSQALVGLFSTQ